MRNEIELWAPVPGYEGNYEVSSLGRVRSLERHVTSPSGQTNHVPSKLLKATPGRDGYPTVGLWKQGRSTTFRVHRLVARSFVPGEAPTLEVCHSNGVRTDNRASNLRWDTRAANIADMFRHGTDPHRSKTHCINGHEYTPENTKVNKKGARTCRNCRNAVVRARRSRLPDAIRARANNEARARRDGEILRLRDQGLTQGRIGKALGMTQAGVCAALKRLDRPAPLWLTEDEVDDA